MANNFSTVAPASTAPLSTKVATLELDDTYQAGVSAIVDASGARAKTLSVSAAGAAKVDGSAVTQPVSGTVTANAGTGTLAVSAASLPLPSGASTAAKQPALGTAGTASADVITVQGIASMTPLKVDNSANTQPVSGTVTANAGTGTLAVSLASVPSHAVTNAGTFAVQSAATLAAETTKVIGTVNVAAGQTIAVTNAGTFAAQATLAAGSAVIGKVAIDQTTPGTTNLVALAANQSVNNAQVGGTNVSTGNGVVGAGVQRVAIASDNSALATTPTPPTLTKATQGATGYSTQDLKDAGRVIVVAVTAIAGVTAVTTEALLTLSLSRDGAAASGVTTIPVTSGKRFRVQSITVGAITTAAVALNGRISLRMNPSGAATATSVILATVPIATAAGGASTGVQMSVPIPDGLELSGTMQIGLSQVFSAITGTVWASIIGYEY